MRRAGIGSKLKTCAIVRRTASHLQYLASIAIYQHVTPVDSRLDVVASMPGFSQRLSGREIGVISASLSRRK